MDLSKLNTRRENCPFKIDAVEKKYNATYVAELCLKFNGSWVNSPAYVFYQEKPPVEDYSHYFALIIKPSGAFITSGASAVEGTIWAVEADDGEIIYSSYRHDYHQSKDKSVIIDGGRDYIKSSTNKVIGLEIKEGKFVLASLDKENNIHDNESKPKI